MPSGRDRRNSEEQIERITRILARLSVGVYQESNIEENETSRKADSTDQPLAATAPEQKFEDRGSDSSWLIDFTSPLSENDINMISELRGILPVRPVKHTRTMKGFKNVIPVFMGKKDGREDPVEFLENLEFAMTKGIAKRWLREPFSLSTKVASTASRTLFDKVCSHVGLQLYRSNSSIEQCI